MSAMTFPAVMRLAFDPHKSGGEGAADLRAVFNDPLARALWLTFRSNHIVDQHFSQACLSAVKLIRAAQPSTAEALLACMRPTPGGRYAGDHHFIGSDMPAFVEAFLPYVTGQAKIYYQVVP